MPRNVLIIDDDEPVRRALARNLRARGFQVSTAGSVGEALTVLDGHDVVIVDLVLGDAPGTVILRNVRRQCQPPRIAVLSGLDDSVLLSEAKALLPDAIFHKRQVDELITWLGDPG